MKLPELPAFLIVIKRREIRLNLSSDMTEAEIIRKIKGLKQIKPRKDWVALTRREIFSQEPMVKQESPSLIWNFLARVFLNYRIVFTTLLFFGVLISTAFSLAQNSLPGDLLYSLKKISEKGQSFFVSQEDKPKIQLEFANKRLEELTKIAEKNQFQKLAPAINEFQQSFSRATENLKKPKAINKEIVDQVKKLEATKEKAEALGVATGETEELTNTLKELTEREIKDLEKRTLTDDQERILDKAKEDFETGNYTSALEKILEIGQQ